MDRNPLHPRPCQAEPVWAGLVYTPYPKPGVTSWAFTCDVHKDGLAGARSLLDRDRAELERRRRAWQAGLDGQEWVPTRPLAVGAAARELIRRATS